MFYDPAKLAFARALSAAAPVIRAEFAALADADFVPWLERDLYAGDSWRVFPLFNDGMYESGPYAAIAPLYAQNRARCPRTCALLQELGGCTTAAFSRMEPGAHIVPHHGSERAVYRCHLCLVEAPDCALAFGADVRTWRAGECLVFEDTVMHEAWNRGDRARIVLLADFQKHLHPLLP